MDLSAATYMDALTDTAGLPALPRGYLRSGQPEPGLLQPAEDPVDA